MANDLQTNIDIIDDFTQRLQVAVIGAEETTTKHEKWVEGTAVEVIQTANGPIKTLRGLIADWDALFQNSFDLTVQGYDAQFAQKLLDFDQEFVNYLLTVGFEPAIIYQPGITLTRRPQTVAYQGVTYYWAGTLPYTTSGDFTSEPDWLIAPVVGGIEIPQMTFASGGNIVRKTQSVLGTDGEWYFWTGSFPKLIPPSSTLETVGGVGLNKFKTASGAVPLRPLMKIVATAAGVVLNSGSFEYGATITSSSQVLAEFSTGRIWKWNGPIPKVVDTNSTPLNSGGTGLNLWNEITTATGTSGAGITISETPPSGVGTGHRWYCTTDGRTYIRYADGDSVQWVEESPQGSVFDGMEPRVREGLRRSYADAGLNLVSGSFELGFTLVHATDVALHETSGKAFSGPAGGFPAGTNPFSGGFIDESGTLSADESSSYSDVRAYVGAAKTKSVFGRVYSGDGGEGTFDRDDSDTTTPDDDCTVLVSATGVRWKRRGVSNTVNVAWAGAKPNSPTTDSTAAFKNAMKAVYRLSKTLVSAWPSTVRCALVGPSGDYYFSSGFITPDFSAPNFVNYDIIMPDAVFHPMASYDLRFPLIHAKACFEYTWDFGVFGFQSTTGANDTMYAIFNDSSREQNYGGKCTYRIKAADTEYVIRHELESVVASFDQCMTNKNIKRFLRVWRCDQAYMNGCYFNWEQAGRSTYDSFIQWNLDDGSTSEPSYPGDGTYNPGRLTVNNSMFIPNGTGVPRVHTGWIENVGGVVMIGDACHFGPESNNRPSVVLNRAIGATFSNQADLTESGIYIDGASCASSWDIVYCISDYPNVISIKNIRWNTIDYSGGAKLTYLIGGDAAVLNAKSSKYSPKNRSFFHFQCDAGAPSWKNVNNAVSPDLAFANSVATYMDSPYALAPWVSLPATVISYDLDNRDGLMPAVPNACAYEVTNTYSINSLSDGKLTTSSSRHLVSLVKNGLNMELEVTPLMSPPPGVVSVTPTMTAVFVGPAGSEVSTAPRTSIDAGSAYFIRLKYETNAATNSFVSESLRIRKLS